MKEQFTDSVPLNNPFYCCLTPLVSPQTSWMEQHITELGDEENQPVLDDSLYN